MRGTRTVARLVLMVLPPMAASGTRPGAAAEEVPVRTAQAVREFEPAPPPLGAPVPAPPPGPAAVLQPTVEPVDPPVPTVALRVRVPAVAPPDQPLQYRILVENTSRAKAHHVVVRNPLPANVEYVRATPEPNDKAPNLRWDFGTLEPLAHHEIILVVKPTGPGDVRSCARVQFDHGQCVTTRITDGSAPHPMPPAPKLEGGRAELRLRMTGPPQPMVPVGPEIVFRMEVENVGTALAQGVVLTNTLPKELAYSTSTPAGRGDNPHVWDWGDLQPGQRRNVDCTVLPLKAGACTSRAEVRDATGRKWETSSTVVVGEPKLNVVTTGPSKRPVSRPASYSITVTNPGTIPAADVTVITEVAEGMTLVSASLGGKLGPPLKRFDKQLNRDVTYREIRWPAGTLMPKSTRVFQVVLKTDNAGTLEHTARAEAAGGLKALSPPVRTLFEKAAGLTVEINKDSQAVEVGGEVGYTVSILNQGQAPAAKVAVTLTIPEQMEVVAKRPGDPTEPLRGEGRQLIFGARAAPLEAGAKAVYSIRLKALTAGEARLRVAVTSETLPGGPLQEQDSTIIYADKQAPPNAEVRMQKLE